MEKNYWILFSLTTIGSLFFITMIILGGVFYKKLFMKNQHRYIMATVWFLIAVGMLAICLPRFAQCCQDYSYVSNGTYIESKATVKEFEKRWTDYDGNGQTTYSNPLLQLTDGSSIVLPLTDKDVEIGKTYLIRYYPATKICKVMAEIKK